MTGPLDMNLVVERLRARCGDRFRLLGAAADLASAVGSQGTTATPCAFAVLTEETANPAPMSNMLALITRTAYIDVVIGARNYRAADKGSAHMDDARTLVGAVRQALNGFVIGPGAEPCWSDGRARLWRYEQNELWWVDRYSITYRTQVESN